MAEGRTGDTSYVFARGLKSVSIRDPSSITATSALQSFGAPLI